MRASVRSRPLFIAMAAWRAPTSGQGRDARKEVQQVVMAVARGVLQLAVLLQLVPLCADAYSRGAGSCHTASGGHGEATAGAGGFVLSLSAAPTAGSTVALRLVHAEAVSQFKGFLVKITGPGGEYDGGGAESVGWSSTRWLRASDVTVRRQQRTAARSSKILWSWTSSCRRRRSTWLRRWP